LWSAPGHRGEAGLTLTWQVLEVGGNGTPALQPKTGMEWADGNGWGRAPLSALGHRKAGRAGPYLRSAAASHLPLLAPVSHLEMGGNTCHCQHRGTGGQVGLVLTWVHCGLLFSPVCE
jgi:hypothetical protein